MDLFTGYLKDFEEQLNEVEQQIKDIYGMTGGIF